MGVEVELLEHEPDLLPEPAQIDLRVVDRHAVYMYLTIVDGLELVDAPDERAFSRPGRPADHDDFARINMEIHVIEDMEIAKPLVDLFEGDHAILK
jgi:hypothetical protein